MKICDGSIRERKVKCRVWDDVECLLVLLEEELV